MKYTKIIKKEIKVMIVVVVILLLVVLGVSYALFMQVTDNTNNQVVTTGSLQIEYASTNGYIENDTYKELLPMSNDQGLLQSGYEFNVKNTGSLPVAYNVYLYINEEEYNKDIEAGTISGSLFDNLSLIHYNLQTNDDGNTDINILSEQTIKEEDGITKYILHSDEVSSKTNAINNHKLRIWLSEDADVEEIGKYIYLKLEVTSYVKGQEEKIICKRATELHEEICSNSDSTAYCLADGYTLGDTITYGNETITSGVLTSGDAFDCDVNGDGIYDDKLERFYYVTDMNENIAVLSYYSNVSEGVADSANNYAYNINYSLTEYYGPKTAMKQLPTTEQWKIELASSLRNITDESGVVRVLGFNYENKAARLLTAQEINASCNITIGNYNVKELEKCNYLLENTKYSSSQTGTYGYWIESPRASYSEDAWVVVSFDRSVRFNLHVDNSDNYGVRPVIEVSKSNITY